MAMILLITLVQLTTPFLTLAWQRATRPQVTICFTVDTTVYQHAKIHTLAEYIHTTHDDPTCLVIYRAYDDMPRSRLELHLGSYSNVIWHELQMSALSPGGKLTDGDAYNAIVDQYPEAEVVLMIAQLPMAYSGMLHWDEDARQAYRSRHGKEPPALAIMNGYVYYLKPHFRHDRVTAAMTYLPDARYRKYPTDCCLKHAYEERYLLVTPENVEALDEQYDDLF